MAIVIGIDGGGSKTLAMVAGLDGAVIGRGAGGPSNYQGVGLVAALAALDEALAAALRDAGRSVEEARAVVLGLAGAGRVEDQAPFLHWAARRLPGAQAAVVNDADLVLAAGSPEGWGLAVIAGTGSIAYGRGREGGTARAGGWGPLLGDEGSGYAIGRAALRAAAAAWDGRAQETALLPAILAHWSLPDASALIGKAYRPPLAPADVAALAALVEQSAEAGDEVAGTILEEAGRELATTAVAVARKLGMAGKTPCACAGSVLVRGRRVLAAFEARLLDLGIVAGPLARVEEPALGGVRLALGLLSR